MSERIVLVTQRSDRVPGRPEVRDALEASWAACLWESGWVPFPAVNVPGAAAAQFEALRPRLVILTGGNDAPGTGEDRVPMRDETESVLMSLAARTGTPLLGVCRGAQMLALAAGMRLVRVESHVRVRHGLVGPLVDGWRGPAEVASFHHWGIEEGSVPRGWDVLARSEDGGVEAFASADRPSLGILWHPEREPRHLPAVLEYLEARYP
ncbi:C26 family cysteine hydrolase domain-containing family [Pyxidicoccus fallax]|uniref:C26 family cysteine hydrolase domain-containing family n=1 Tax=Pyxidicoccus fallax TaxID=394095 RepID=A0A848LGN8_9BACT|nr:gamma-glutamyl-gamma-aminobutyrate hydrolase family protein [Pyxidicoccus fallax]NMO16545.1 C26 family cysteine hydrolase domain-containing family [Pyxidicoccus fallax]NPC78134.1 C26 family cysteine hydrolase domain-containing family [Pyxidicoccus fallax]